MQMKEPDPPRRGHYVTPAQRRARKPNWRHAEDYFRRERDAKLPITLPRVSILEAEPGDD